MNALIDLMESHGTYFYRTAGHPTGIIGADDVAVIELVNNTGTSVNLSGWTLSAADGTPSIALSGSIPPSGYFLLERTDDDTVPGVAPT